MQTISVKNHINLKVIKLELNFVPTTLEVPKEKRKAVKIAKVQFKTRVSSVPPPPVIKNTNTKKCDVKELVEDLLDELYSEQRDWSYNSGYYCGRGSFSTESFASSSSHYGDQTDAIERSYLENLEGLVEQIDEYQAKLRETGERLARSVKVRDRLRRQQKKICAAFTVLLRHITGEPGARFGMSPSSDGEGGYSEWLHAMRLVARLPAGVPQHFRRKLWLTLAERHLTARGICWAAAERACFKGTALPDDAELGAQIIKDLHRTGCSLFCGTEGRENQAMLRRVLLAYARWNKDVGYCQGFNMLAAIILEVMDKSESDSLKVMIYLVEAVLPEGYFADDLRGLSADMAAFRDLLRIRIPRLANHMDHLQRISDGGGVEPPLPDVFTMQWFLTLYATWLQRDSLLRIWDLVLLDGNEVLLLTALAIWDMLQDRILSARSADEYYSSMGGGAGAVWEAGDALVARVVALGTAPELPRLRNLHRYRVAPPAPPAAPVNQPPLHSAVQTMTKRGLRLFYSEDEGESSDDGNKMALATVTPRREERMGAGDRLSLDIGALKRQYARLRERQRQAHVILAAACARHAAVGVPTSPTSLTVNSLLLGKSAIVSSRGRRLGPPPGAIPPTRQTATSNEKADSKSGSRAPETMNWKDEKHRKRLSRRNSLKWKDIKKEKVLERVRRDSIDLDERGDGVIVSEREVNEICASLRSRSSSETSSYSTHSDTSSDTSLCDENEKESDSEPDLPEESNIKVVNDLPKLSPTILVETLVDTAVNEKEVLSCPGKASENISDFIATDAGAQLRTYIGGFETKLKDTDLIDRDKFSPISPSKLSTVIDKFEINDDTGKDDVIRRLNKSPYTETLSPLPDIRLSRPTRLPKSPKNFTDLSPVDISPCNFDMRKLPYGYCLDYERSSTPKVELNSRPDIIDSFTMYPNFIPDIDLSDKNLSDFESPVRSPGAESIVVSEDEPPIPLHIDKYFEHSPDFFGARITVTDPYNTDISSRRPSKRLSRLPKKPDSLTLQSNHNDKLPMKEEMERASSLPQNHSFKSKDIMSVSLKETDLTNEIKLSSPLKTDSETQDKMPLETTFGSYSPKDYFLQSGRKNSERALQIIQENSKILSRILTKQNYADKSLNNTTVTKSPRLSGEKHVLPIDNQEVKNTDSPILKESTSDSLIGYSKTNNMVEKNEFMRIRPISIDDPFSLETRNVEQKTEDVIMKSIKSPSTDCLLNKTDLYGWENKGFLAKCDYETLLNRPPANKEFEYKSSTNENVQSKSDTNEDQLQKYSVDWKSKSLSDESKPSVTLPSSEQKEEPSLDKRFASSDYNFSLTSNYNDFVLSKASDICSKTVDQGPKVCEKLLKTESSQFSDLANVVTSSISFTYEASANDDSPIGAKSNSSDTLCQITSLDQVSTPISPKIFPRDTPSLPKDFTDKNDIRTDDTCSTITSLIETETISSLSYPQSPSTGSYHPFPTRPAMRMPKELGVKLGMYPKDVISSPPK